MGPNEDSQKTVELKDHKRGKKNPVVKTVYICNDNELSDAYNDANEELMSLRLRYNDERLPEELKERYDFLVESERTLRVQMRENSMVFKFRAIGRKAMERLVSENPPTEADIKKVKEAGGEGNLDWSPDTFLPALCDSCCIQPNGFDFFEAWDSPDWNEVELAALGQTALEANVTRRIVPLGNG